MLVKKDLMFNLFKFTCKKERYNLGLANSPIESTLSFLDNEKFIKDILDNKNICAVITTKNLSKKITNTPLEFFLSDDPRFDYYTLYNKLSKENYHSKASIIDKTAVIHPTAYVSEFNVVIGKNVHIYPHVTILADVEIGDNCIIQSGTVIGSEGFEYKKTTKGILPVFHDGKVLIKNDVHIGANTCIDKGFSFKNTCIDNQVKIDNLIHVAHGVHIKEGAFIIAGTILGGSSIIEEETWLSINTSIAPSITVKKKGFVSIGAVVTKNVEEGQQVTGNFAVSHDKFLKSLKKKLSE